MQVDLTSSKPDIASASSNPDTESCLSCDRTFSNDLKRHQCRVCGRWVCGPCSSNRMNMSRLKLTAARVCDPCFQKSAPSYLQKRKPHEAGAVLVPDSPIDPVPASLSSLSSSSSLSLLRDELSLPSPNLSVSSRSSFAPSSLLASYNSASSDPIHQGQTSPFSHSSPSIFFATPSSSSAAASAVAPSTITIDTSAFASSAGTSASTLTPAETSTPDAPFTWTAPPTPAFRFAACAGSDANGPISEGTQFSQSLRTRYPKKKEFKQPLIEKDPGYWSDDDDAPCAGCQSSPCVCACNWKCALL
eukprot:TRINITY_DN5835_c0_g1_i1.p1 TRINITY_DN5835_c0_g1~~TRINITY_DN5835_c0_g1_i1.p1  ORF type:complete len:303 (+),score=61.43 TRINITY_DN5835_c0_g1_i1:85-993(+)